MIKVSIIVPVYNTEQYLDKCIKSILNQTFKYFELILINDGSNDSSLDICRKYSNKDNRIVIVDNKNQGVSTARNIGISKARGEFILFVDSDDYVDNTWCEELYNTITMNSEKMCLCRYKKCYLKSGNVSINKKIDREINNISLIDKVDIFKVFKEELLNSPWNKIYISKILKDKKIRFQKNLSLGEDLLFNIEYLKYVKNDIVILNKNLYNYVISEENSLSNKYYEDLFSINKRIYSELYYFMKENGNSISKYREEFYSTYLNSILIVFNNTFNKSSNKKFLEKIGYNSKILKSKEYKECLKYSDLSEFNKLYRFIMKRQSYIYMYIYIKVANFKNIVENKIMRIK